MDGNVIGGRDFAEMLSYGANNLALHRTEVNDLNVFPIPDGDTGDNMLMTFTSGIQSIGAKNDLPSVTEAVAEGMLLGARGNSGVILSRIFAGIIKELCACEYATLDDIKRGMKNGVKESYSAVSKPVEGTILTVFKDAVNYAEKCDNGAIAAYFSSITREMARSLERTPDLLPVLKEAGVVDSGGAGLLFIFEGIAEYVNGETTDKAFDEIAATSAEQSNGANIDYSLFTADSTLDFGYCTEFLLRLQNAKTDVKNFDVDAFIKVLEKNGGDSVVAFKEDSILKVHVHTKSPGDVFNFAQKFGEFLKVKIENMTFQNNEAVKRGNNAQTALRKKRKKHQAVVVVAAGDGIKDAFSESGVDYIVDGGQSMNPSAQDFITAFNEVNAERIIVFPNNANVILTANQAAGLYKESEIVVVESKTVGECYAALSLADLSGDTDTVKQQIDLISGESLTGYVSTAIRDTDAGGVAVRRGDYIGFAGGEVFCDFKSRKEAAIELVDHLNANIYGLLIIFVGADANEQEAEEIAKAITAKYKYLEVVVRDGGQPIYDYMFVFE